jgi:hypothetical protein
MKNNIKLKTVKELLEMKFFIPSYQRGYRWTNQQVEELLNDAYLFEPQIIEPTNEKTWYCLQPLVVNKMNEDRKGKLNTEVTHFDGDWYEVIDGQQRLTTIFIILNILDPNSFLKMRYQTRPQSEEFLKDIKDNDNIDNIDFYFMLEAKKTVTEWKRNKTDIDHFVDKLKNYCKVIWYKTEDNAYDVFKRLNSGKISLSNAELVKALLLKDDNFKDESQDATILKQLEMANEWDRIEQTLQNDSLWFFINPDPESSLYKSTRMDFVLEMILRIERNADNSDKYNVHTELQKNQYFIFNTFYNIIYNSEYGWKECWEKIHRLFRILKSWYEDRQLYHYIGYLMNLKGADKIDILKELIIESDKKKTDFRNGIKKMCTSLLGKFDMNQEFHFEKLKYGNNNNEIHNILLLFNLATTQNQISEQARYPFDRHFQAAKEKWSLEHIHAQNERKAEWKNEEVENIKRYLNTLPGENIQKLKKFLNVETIKNEQVYNAVIGAFMGYDIEESKDEQGKTFYKNKTPFDKDDHLTNMALLQGNKNAAFNNKLYPEKRKELASYEDAKKETEFIPICTRNVFFKHYSPEDTNPLVWDEKAGKDYVHAIVNVIATYLDLQKFYDDKDTLIYGLKRKDDKK